MGDASGLAEQRRGGDAWTPRMLLPQATSLQNTATKTHGSSLRQKLQGEFRCTGVARVSLSLCVSETRLFETPERQRKWKTGKEIPWSINSGEREIDVNNTCSSPKVQRWHSLRKISITMQYHKLANYLEGVWIFFPVTTSNVRYFRTCWSWDLDYAMCTDLHHDWETIHIFLRKIHIFFLMTVIVCVVQVWTSWWNASSESISKQTTI